MASSRPLDAADAFLILDHFAGDNVVPNSIFRVLLAKLPKAGHTSPRFCCGLALRSLVDVLAAAGDALSILDGARRLLSDPDVADLFPEDIWNAASAVVGTDAARADTALETLRGLVEAEWGKLPPSRLGGVYDRIAGSGAMETWAQADAATRAKLRVLVGEAKEQEILAKLQQLAPMALSEVDKGANAPNPSCANTCPPATFTWQYPRTTQEIANRRLGTEADPGIQEDNAQPADKLANEAPGKDPSAAEVMDGQTAPHIEEQPPSNDKGKRPLTGPKPSLMERNPTAHAYEWDGSDNLTSGGREGPSKNRQLPSFERKPPATFQHKMKRKWSEIEVKTLYEGVQKYGKGCWKEIKMAYPAVFENRSVVDLKDKFRNMERHWF